MTVSKLLKKKSKLLLPLLPLKTASKNTVLIKPELVAKILHVSELFKIVSMNAMITKHAGLTVLQRKEIPQQVLSGSVFLIMIALIKYQLQLLSKILNNALKRNALINGLLARKIPSANLLSMTA